MRKECSSASRTRKVNLLEAVYAFHDIELAQRGGPRHPDAGLEDSALATSRNKAAYRNPSIEDLAVAYFRPGEEPWIHRRNKGIASSRRTFSFAAPV
jgi:hypothetical protein